MIGFHTSRRRAAVLLFAGLLVGGCSTSPVTGPAGLLPVASTTTSSTGAALFEIDDYFPKGSSRRRPQYVSVDTAALRIRIDGRTKTLSFTPLSPHCHLSAARIRCAIKAAASNGTTSYVVTALDSNGFALSTTAGKTRIKGTTAIHLTLHGIASRVALSVAGTPTIGTRSSFAVTLSAYDAAGALIVGPAPYDAPIRLQNSDRSGAFTLNTDSVTSPASKIVLHYSGAVANTNLKAQPAKPATEQNVTVYPSAGVRLFHVGSNPFGGAFLVSGSLVPGLSGDMAVAYPNGFATISSGGTVTGHSSSLTINAMSVGSDGAYWMARSQCVMPNVCQTNYVSRYSGSTFADYPVASEVTSIVSGPNGRLWGLSPNPETVFAVSTAGTVQAYTVPNAIPNAPGFDVSNVAVAADGNVWFYDRSSAGYNRFVAVAPDGTMTEVKVQGVDAPSIAAGAGGKLLWLAQTGYGGLGELTVSTRSFRSFANFPALFGGNTIPIASDANGNAWVQVSRPQAAQPNQVFVAFVKRDGTAALVSLPNSKELTELTSLRFAADGTLWFASDTAVGTVDLGGS